MDSTRLKYFVAAAQYLNFSEVARINYTSQPTISRQIGLLEQELDTKLFFWEGKTLRLTSEGEFFLPLATKILGDWQDAVTELQRFKQGKTGTIKIMLGVTCRAAYQKCLTAFSRRYPDILLETSVASSYEQMEQIPKGDYDIYFVGDENIREYDQYEFAITQQDVLCLAMPKNWPDLEDLMDFAPLENRPYAAMGICNSFMLAKDLEAIFRKRNYTPQVVGRYNRVEDILLSVAAGVGFTILPYSVAVFYPYEGIKYFPLPDREAYVNQAVAWKKHNHNSTAKHFVSVIRELYPADS